MSNNLITSNAIKRLIVEKNAKVVQQGNLLAVLIDNVGHVPIPHYYRNRFQQNAVKETPYQDYESVVIVDGVQLHYTDEFLNTRPAPILKPDDIDLLRLIALSPDGYRDQPAFPYALYGNGLIDVNLNPDKHQWRVRVSGDGELAIHQRTGKTVAEHRADWQAKQAAERATRDDNSVFAAWRGGLLVFTCNNLSGFYAEYSPASARVTVHGSVLTEQVQDVGAFMITVAAILQWRTNHNMNVDPPPYLLGETRPRPVL